MTSFCATSTKSYARKESDELGGSSSIKRSFDLELEVKFDDDDPVDEKILLIDEVLEYLTNIRKTLAEELENN